jgi:type II restriction/modification system DNA methylase subunit YeeA
MAWPDEPWILEGADVRISIIGFDDGQESGRVLGGEVVASINSDLTATLDISGVARLRENEHIGFKGIDRSGPFDLAPSIGKEFLAKAGNPNARPNSDVIRPWVNATDVMGRSRGGWIIDFGVGMSAEDAAMYEGPFEYVVAHVKPIRATNRRPNYRDKWWIHGEPRPGLRKAIFGLERILVTPHHSKHRVFTWLDPSVLPSNALVVFAREDDYFFGVLHSRVHEVWSLRMGTWLGKGNDPRYTATTCFETFPFPWPPGAEPVSDPLVQEIAAAAKELDERRRAWLDPPGASEADLKKRTLTNLYNERPTWLAHLHERLDRAVWAAYGWEDEEPRVVPEETILERLLGLNLERAG